MHIHASTCLLVDKTKGININPNSGSVWDMCNRAQGYYAFVIQWVFNSTGVCKPNVWWNISILAAVVRVPLTAWKIRELDGKELAVGSLPTYEDYVRLCTSQFVSYLSFERTLILQLYKYTSNENSILFESTSHIGAYICVILIANLRILLFYIILS